MHTTESSKLSPQQAQGLSAQWKVIATLAVGTFAVASEMSLTAFALPQISAAFEISPATSAWVLLIYMLPLVGAAIPAGRWVDMADVKLVFIVALALNAAASLVGLVSGSFTLFMASRVVQGFAAAVFFALYMPLIAQSIPHVQRGRAISIVASMMMLGSIALAPLAGWVAAQANWQAVLLIKLPLIAAALFLGHQVLPCSNKQGTIRGRLPPHPPGLWLDCALMLCAAAALLFALEFVGRSLHFAVLLLLVALGCLAAWARLAQAKPVLDLITMPLLGLPALAMMCVAAMLGLTSFSLPFFVSDVMGLGSEQLSVAMLGFVLPAAAVSPLAGSLADRYGALRVATAGAALSAAGLLSLLSVEPQSSIVHLALCTAAAGSGMAVFNAPTVATMLQAAPAEATGIASGLSNVARMGGYALGPAIAALAWNISGGGSAGFQAGVLVLSASCAAGFAALLLAAALRP